MQEANLKTVSDDELLRDLSEILKTSRWAEADLVARIAEVDARKLWAREAAPSMFAYCTESLHLSEQEAYLRIAVGRAPREHPMLLAMLRDGRLHLSGIARLAPHLTRENRESLLARAAHKSHRQIVEMVAELAPKPSVPATIRKLPAPKAVAPPASDGRLGANGADSLSPVQWQDGAEGCAVGLSADVVVRGGDARPLGEGVKAGAATPPKRGQRPDGQLCAHRVEGFGGGLRTAGGTASPIRVEARAASAPGRGAAIEPVAPARFRVRFDASAEFRDKLERLQALTRSSVPDGDLAKVIELVVTRELERLEARRFGKTGRPRKGLAGSDTRPKSRHIPAAVRRFVERRDGGRCTYRDIHGRRCTKRHDLEFHHDGTPFGRGGDHSPDNVRLVCRAHNALLAEREYGKEKMAQYWRSGGPCFRADDCLRDRIAPVHGGTPRGSRQAEAGGPHAIESFRPLPKPLGAAGRRKSAGRVRAPAAAR